MEEVFLRTTDALKVSPLSRNSMVHVSLLNHRAENTHPGSRTSKRRMKSCASSDTSSNSSSGKSTSARDMLQKVSWSVSPPNGENPVRRTYVVTPRDLVNKHLSQDRNAFIIVDKNISSLKVETACFSEVSALHSVHTVQISQSRIRMKSKLCCKVMLFRQKRL